MMHEQRLNSRGLLLLLVCFALFVGGTLQDPVVYKYEVGQCRSCLTLHRRVHN